MRNMFPVGDEDEHVDGPLCSCNPGIIIFMGEETVIHRYFDHREIIIQAEVAIGVRCKDCYSYLDEKGEHTDVPPPEIDEMAN